MARQLRLRDLGGLVVIDFIDMESQRNQREVENTLRDALHADRARVQTGKISRFGLLELSRQRLRPSLGETNHAACPRCSGTGHIRGIESTALHILRITQEEAMKDNSAIIQVQLPVEAATFLLNEKRADIHKIEQRMGVEVVLIPNVHMETPNYSITRIKQDDVTEETSQASYKMVELPAETAYERGLSEDAKPKAPEALVKGIKTATSAPLVEQKAEQKVEAAAIAKTSIFGRIKKWFSGESEVKTSTEATETATREAREAARGNDRNRNNNRDRDRNRNRDRNANNRDRNNVAGNAASSDKAQQQQAKPQQARPERQERPQRQDRTDNRNIETKHETRAEVSEKVESTVAAVGLPNAAVTDANQPPRSERSGRRSRGGRNRNKNRDANREEGREPRDPNAAAPAFVPNDAVVDATPIVVKVEAVQSSASANSAKETPAKEAQAAEVVAKETPAKTEKPQKPAKAKAPKPIAVDANIEMVSTKKVTPDANATQAEAEKPAKPKAAKKPARKPAKAADLGADSSQGGLQLVETKGDAKIAAPVDEPAKPKAPRKAPNWKKAAEAKSDEAALVMVETQK